MHVHPLRNYLGFHHVELHDGYLGYSRRATIPYRESQLVADDYFYWLKNELGISADVTDTGIECNSYVARPWMHEEKYHPTNWVTEKMCIRDSSDTLVIADGNFPSESIGRGGIVIRMDGHSAPEVLEAVLELFPLDSYISQPVSLMEVMSGDTVETPIWDTYEEIVKRCSGLEGLSLIHI